MKPLLFDLEATTKVHTSEAINLHSFPCGTPEYAAEHDTVVKNVDWAVKTAEEIPYDPEVTGLSIFSVDPSEYARYSTELELQGFPRMELNDISKNEVTVINHPSKPIYIEITYVKTSDLSSGRGIITPQTKSKIVAEKIKRMPNGFGFEGDLEVAEFLEFTVNNQMQCQPQTDERVLFAILPTNSQEQIAQRFFSSPNIEQ